MAAWLWTADSPSFSGLGGKVPDPTGSTILFGMRLFSTDGHDVFT